MNLLTQKIPTDKKHQSGFFLILRMVQPLNILPLPDIYQPPIPDKKITLTLHIPQFNIKYTVPFFCNR